MRFNISSPHDGMSHHIHSTIANFMNKLPNDAFGKQFKDIEVINHHSSELINMSSRFNNNKVVLIFYGTNSDKDGDGDGIGEKSTLTTTAEKITLDGGQRDRFRIYNVDNGEILMKDEDGSPIGIVDCNVVIFFHDYFHKETNLDKILKYLIGKAISFFNQASCASANSILILVNKIPILSFVLGKFLSFANFITLSTASFSVIQPSLISFSLTRLQMED